MRTSPAARIPVLKPQLPATERLLPYLRRIDSTSVYSNFGPLALAFGRRLAQHFRLPAPSVVVAASGTAALIGAILATAGRASQERPLALVPAFTFIATASAAEACGYRVKVDDVDPKDFGLDPDRLLAEHDLDGVGLVVPVGAFGRPVDQKAWTEFRTRLGFRSSSTARRVSRPRRRRRIPLSATSPWRSASMRRKASASARAAVS